MRGASQRAHPQNSSTERAHVVLFLAHFITLTLAQVRALSALHSWSSTCHPYVRPLHLELHSLLPSFPPVLLPLPLLPPQRRAAAGAQQEDHGKPALTPRPTGMRGTYDVLYLTRGCEPKAHDFNGAPELIGHPLLQDPCRGPGRG